MINSGIGELALATIEDKVNNFKQLFQSIVGWEEKYQKMIELGKNLPTYPEEKRLESFKIKGCQSQVWLYPSFDKGVITFYADSDALLVKGIVAVLLNVYSELSPEDILKVNPIFLKDLGITEHLSMNRTNGLASMIKQIQLYAKVYLIQGKDNK